LKRHSALMDDLADDSHPGDGFSFDNPPVDGFCYSPEDIAILQSWLLPCSRWGRKTQAPSSYGELCKGVPVCQLGVAVHFKYLLLGCSQMTKPTSELESPETVCTCTAKAVVPPARSLLSRRERWAHTQDLSTNHK
jgi:hypothetical protein